MRIKKILICLIVVTLMIMAGCKDVMNNNHDDVSTVIEAEETPILTLEPPPLSSVSQPENVTKDPPVEQHIEPYVTGLQFEGEQPMEPNASNGASYIKNYRGTLFFADNNYLWTLKPQKGRIPNVLEPLCFDIYKDVLYYIKEDSNVLYAVNLTDFSVIEVLDDVYSSPSPHTKSFVIAGDKVFYNSKDTKLCSFDINQKETTVISNNPAFHLKYCDGWVYYRNGAEAKLFRIRIDGSGEECLIKEPVDYFFVDKSSVKFQAAREGIVYVNELSGGNEITIMQKELEHKESNSDGQFELINVKDDTVTYYQNVGKMYTIFIYSNKESMELVNNMYVDNFIFPIEFIDGQIYCFGDKEENRGLFQISLDGTMEKVAEYYRTPQQYLPG